MKHTLWTSTALLALTLLLLAACSAEIQPVPVDSVSVEQRDGEYVAVVEGQFRDACGEIGATVQTVQDDTIRVGTLLAPTPPDMMCAQVITPFTETIPLDTSGLPPGEYQVSVNSVTAPLRIGPETAAQPASRPAPVASVEVEQRNGTTVLVISGDMPDPCHEVGEVTQRVENGAISVNVGMTPPPPDTVCAQVITPYTIEVPIEAQLEPGEYTVEVNDFVADVTVE